MGLEVMAMLKRVWQSGGFCKVVDIAKWWVLQSGAFLKGVETDQ